MTSENKNKSGLKAKSGILVLGLVVIILAGILNPVLSPAKIALAEPGTCVYKEDIGVFKKGNPVPGISGHDEAARARCIANARLEWIPTSTTNPPSPSITAYQQCINNRHTREECKNYDGAPSSRQATNPNESDFEKAMQSRSCASLLKGFDIAWCFVRVAYTVFYTFPAFLLWASAEFFNYIIAITLSSRLFTDSAFIPQAWAIVRDLSNIFFILILLYIAVQIILDIRGSEAKKMIAKVIILALLINFSMFMTAVVIDTSNITALIFYNKINVCTKGNEAVERCKSYKVGDVTKDVSGGLVSNFDPTTKLNAKFFEKASEQPVPGSVGVETKNAGEVPAGIMFGIIMITGLLMFFAAYVFFVAGFSFLGRLIELWVLIIFSPFAFMSFSIPLLEKIEYIGWKDWSSNLIKVSFMAPIFMFFLYFIFMLAKADIFNGLIAKTEDMSLIESLLLIALPALMILKLLHKAVKFAEKGGGMVADFMGSVGKWTLGIGGGVLGGLAIGGVAKGLQAGGGYLGEEVLRDKRLAEYESAKKEDQTGRFKGTKAFLKRTYGGGLRTLAGGKLADGTGGLVGSSFDLRKGAVSGGLKSLEKITGLNFGSASKILLKPDGGHRGDQQRAAKKRIARNNSLKVARDEALQQKLNKAKEQFYETNNAVSFDIGQIDIRLKGANDGVAIYEPVQKGARSDYEIDKNKLSEKTNAAEKEYRNAKNIFDEIVAGGTTTGPAYTAAKTALDTAKDVLNKQEEYNKAKAAFDTANGTLDSNTRNTTEEQDYNMAKAALDALAASNMAVTDPAYIAAEAAKNTAATAVGAINPAYVAAKDAYDAAEAAKNTAATAVSAIDSTYVALKDTYDKSEKTLREVNEEYKKRSANARGLRDHRKAIKDTKGTADNFDMTNTNSAVFKADKAATDFATAKAAFEALVVGGMAITDPTYILAEKTKKETEEIDKRAKEILRAAEASRDHGKQSDGTFASINDFEDKILPEIEEELENEDRKRMIADAKNFRAEFKSPTIRVLRALFTPAGDNKWSRNAAANEIIEKVSKKKV